MIGKVEGESLLFLITFFKLTAMLISCIIAYFKMKKCNCLTLGTIIEIRVTKDRYKNVTEINYQPIYQYTVSGVDYVNEGSMVSSNPKEYKLNDEVPLYYEENNPNNFIFGGDIKDLKRNIIILAFIFTILLAFFLAGLNTD